MNIEILLTKTNATAYFLVALFGKGLLKFNGENGFLKEKQEHW